MLGPINGLTSKMDKNYTRMWQVIRSEYQCEWLTWIGQPMMYDGGMFVNRSAEEWQVTNLLKFKNYSII